MSASMTKECPFCAERIKAAARGCRFCGTVFPPTGDATSVTLPAQPSAGLPAPSAIGEAEVSELLASLVEKSLVLYEEDEQGRSRYRLLETVRQYGRDRLLESREGEQIRDRQQRFVIGMVEEA